MATQNVVRPAHVDMIQNLPLQGMLDMDLDRLDLVFHQVHGDREQPEEVRERAFELQIAVNSLKALRHQFAQAYRDALKARPVTPEMLMQAGTIGELHALTQQALEVTPEQIAVEIAHLESLITDELGESTDLIINPDDDPVVAARSKYFQGVMFWLDAYRLEHDERVA